MLNNWIFIVIGIILIFSSPSYAEWAMTYGGNGDEHIMSIQQTADGEYVMAGRTSSFGAGDYDIWVLKVNFDGTIAWQNSYGGSAYESAFSIQETADGGYIVAGQTFSFGAGSTDIWILKLDSVGAVVWQKTYGGSGEDYTLSIKQTADGGYVVAGVTGTFGGGYRNFWVLRLNDDGTVLWQKTYGGSGEETPDSIQETKDGGYIVAGQTRTFGPGSVAFWLLKLDSDGAVDWQKSYGGSSSDVASSIQQTADGGYIVAGQTVSFGAGSEDIWVLKLDSTGAVDWQKSYGGSSSDVAYSIQQTSVGGYIVGGETLSFGAGGLDFWVLKLDSTGNVTWQKTYGGSSTDRGFSIQETADGGYIMGGRTSSFGAGSGDIWVLKLDANGEIPSCSYMGESSAIVSVTSVVGQATSVTPQTTSIIPSDTFVIPQDTLAETSAICYAKHTPINVDIKPQSCPNPLNINSQGVLPVAILGTEDFDISTIDLESITLAGVAPIRSSVEDVSTPVIDKQNECDCNTEGGDGFDDLTLKFDTQEIVNALGEVTDGEELVLTLTGELLDGTSIEGEDCIVVLSKGGKGKKK